MSRDKEYFIPQPIMNKREQELLNELTDKYKKMTEPGKIARVSAKAGEIIPKPIKEVGKAAKQGITEVELFSQCMRVVAEGFEILEKQAAKMTISESNIVKKVNIVTKKNEITSLDEVCLARAYDISKLVDQYKFQDLCLAVIEGGATGAFGFTGLPFNLVLSIFLYYRAVQSIAMFYGYDVKKDSAELIIAGDVFMNALSPKSKGTNEMTSIIGKIMVMTETTAIKQTAKKHGLIWLREVV